MKKTNSWRFKHVVVKIGDYPHLCLSVSICGFPLPFNLKKSIIRKSKGKCMIKIIRAYDIRQKKTTARDFWSTISGPGEKS